MRNPKNSTAGSLSARDVGPPMKAGLSYWQSMVELYRRRELIWVLILDELKRRYAGSLLGWSWVVVKPLLLLVLYTFLFGVVFQAKSGGISGSSNYPILILTGLIPWLLFAEALAASTSAISAHASIITKVVFPIEVLPVCRVLAVSLSGLLNIVVLVIILFISHGIGMTIALFPVFLLLQVLFAIGLAWVLATINVTIKDLSEVIPFFLTVWMFLSPVVYTREMLPPQYAWVLKLNPMTYLLETYRSILIENRAPQLASTLICIVVSVSVFLGGFLLFYKRKAMLADEL